MTNWQAHGVDSNNKGRGKMMKWILALLACSLLLFAGVNCGTESPVEETIDTASLEADGTGEFYGDLELIDHDTVYLRLFKAEELLAYIEFTNVGPKTTVTDANVSVKAQAGVGSYHFKQVEPGDYILQISARGYETTELLVTLSTAEQSIPLDKITLVASKAPVSHLRGVLTDASTGRPLPLALIHT